MTKLGLALSGGGFRASLFHVGVLAGMAESGLLRQVNWHNMGYGKIVAFYSPEGTLIRGYALDDLFSAPEIETLPRSVSSIWWRKQVAYVRPDQQSLYVSVDDEGRGFVFETETGAYQFCETRDGAYRCRNANDQRQWRGYRDPPPRR